MNNKNIKVKVIAGIMAFSLMFSNLGLLGNGISKVIAEDAININEQEKDNRIIKIDLKDKNGNTNGSISTLQENVLTYTATLMGKLDNPKIEIKFSKEIEYIKAEDIHMLQGEGIRISKKEAIKNADGSYSILVELEGTQGENIVSITEGLKLTMTLTLRTNRLTPSQSSKIETTVTSENKQEKNETPISIQSKSGLLMLSEWKGHNSSNEILTIMNERIQLKQIDTYSEEKEVTGTIYLLNNYDEDMLEAELIGDLGLATEEQKSTFVASLAEKVSINNNNAKISYSENGEDFKEEVNDINKIRFVKLSIDKIERAKLLQLNLKLKLPANLAENQEDYIRFSLKYKVNEENKTEEQNIKFETEKVQELSEDDEFINDDRMEIEDNEEKLKDTDEKEYKDNSNSSDEGMVDSNQEEEKEENPSNPGEQKPEEKDPTEQNPENPGNKDDENKNPDDQNKDNEENRTYSISGLAWIDSNKNGERESNEQLQHSVIATLVDAQTNEIVKNEDGSNKTVITNNEGKYEFNNIKPGKYTVIFEFDNNTFSVTIYQKENVDQAINSDVISSKITVGGANKLAAITDIIEVKDTEIKNLDIGLIRNAKFDLKLDKYISKVIVKNTQGTETKNYENTNFTKVDLVAKYINSASVIITYKFVITNNGDVTGYVDKLSDNLPNGLEFSSDLNKDWYQGTDGMLYTSLSGIAIEPGKTSEVELILTKQMNEDNTGRITNTASLMQISNLEGISEEDQKVADNTSSADILLSIKTGSPIMYIGITIVSIAIIAAGAYIIKKKVLNKVTINL